MRLDDDDDEMEGFSDEEKKAWQGSKTHEIKVDKVFNSRMTEVFQGSNVEENLQGMIT